MTELLRTDLISGDWEPRLWTPELLDRPSTWWGHVPFAFWIVANAKPRVLVELGTYSGVSYAAFCEAVTRTGLSTTCHAVDTWAGDPQSGNYSDDVYCEFKAFHDERYSAFSSLMRVTFDDAVSAFADGSVDLLHIDGFHTYDSVRHDFETWRPKLSDRAIVLFHDTNERGGDFGVWRFFEEIRCVAPSFEFLHSHGLGVLALGAHAPDPIKQLCALTREDQLEAVREMFSEPGAGWASVNERLHKKALQLRAEEEAPVRALAKRRRTESVGTLAARVQAILPGIRRQRRRTLKDYRTIALSRLFDSEWYLRHNEDVATARKDPILHYLQHGWREGRAPGPIFDGAAYLRANPDVAAAGANPLLHFLETGADEDRPLGVLSRNATNAIDAYISTSRNVVDSSETRVRVLV